MNKSIRYFYGHVLKKRVLITFKRETCFQNLVAIPNYKMVLFVEVR